MKKIQSQIVQIVATSPIINWLAVEEVGHPAAEVARFLGISRVGVLLSLEKAKDICQKHELQLTPPNLTD